MSVGLETAYREVISALGSSISVEEGIASLIKSCKDNYTHLDWEKLLPLPLNADMKHLSTWLITALESEPPSQDIIAFWFGIFNPASETGNSSCDIYVSGSMGFDVDSADWACWTDESYLPKSRYARSIVLNEICRRSKLLIDKEAIEFAEYVLTLGYAALVIREICNSSCKDFLLREKSKVFIAVGFDDGDYINLGRLTRNGLVNLAPNLSGY